MIGFASKSRMPRACLAIGVLAAALFASNGFAAGLSAQSPADRAALALRWAPVHYQDVDQTGSHALGGAADYITRYDFDGDLDARNNWDRAGQSAYPLAAHA